MKTKKPLASICYDEDILKDRLGYLIEKGLIGFWCYIKHYGEQTSGDSERKDHFHVYIEPNDGLDPVEIKEFFKSNDGLPTSLNWRNSKFVDWYYYSIHDVDYLESKGLKKEFVYERKNMVTSDTFELDRLITENDVPVPTKVRNAILSGMSLRDMYLRGLVTPQNANGLRIIHKAMNQESED